MSHIQFILRVIMGTFLIIITGKILLSASAYIGEQIGIRAFVEFIFRKVNK